MSLVLDTGPVLALLDANDPDHRRCVALVERVAEDLVVPSAILVEVDHWCRKLLGVDVWMQFVEDLAAGAYRLVSLEAGDWLRAAELEARYADLGLAAVDAAVLVTCEKLREDKVATLDRRHLSAVRPAHCPALTLLPA